MSVIVGWVWRRLYRLICFECGRIIWRWQPRCGPSHRTCHHAKLLQLWARAEEQYAVPTWPCAYCGWLS